MVYIRDHYTSKVLTFESLSLFAIEAYFDFFCHKRKFCNFIWHLTYRLVWNKLVIYLFSYYEVSEKFYNIMKCVRNGVITGRHQSRLMVTMDSLEELGKKAYQKQIWGDYLEAINIYNTAIKKYPNDPRSLNNRCCCYLEVKDYKKAMEDADLMIRCFPKNAKSYYRKGEVLAGVKRYIEAEESFRKVLMLDLDCEVARQQLLDVQAMQLCQLGYNKEQALKALQLTLNSSSYTANIEDAENILKYGMGELYDHSGDLDIDNIYYSDDENACSNIIKDDSVVYDPLEDPANPLKSTSLWIGFITEGVTEKMLKDIFSKYGKILSVYVYYTSYCAFINYSDNIAPGKAMKALQGKLVGGKNILIKFPDSAQMNKRSKAI